MRAQLDDAAAEGLPPEDGRLVRHVADDAVILADPDEVGDADHRGGCSRAARMCAAGKARGLAECQMAALAAADLQVDNAQGGRAEPGGAAVLELRQGGLPAAERIFDRDRLVLDVGRDQLDRARGDVPERVAAVGERGDRALGLPAALPGGANERDLRVFVEHGAKLADVAAGQVHEEPVSGHEGSIAISD